MARVAAVCLYVHQLLVASTGKLDASSAQSLAQDTRSFDGWCAPVLDVSNGDAPTAASPHMHDADAQSTEALGALESLRELLTVDNKAFADAWKSFLARHRDAPLVIAETLIQRRTDLHKVKKNLLASCQQAHKELYTVLTLPGVFSRALAMGPAGTQRSQGSRWPFKH